MYGWIWRHLPGNVWVKAVCSTVLILGVASLLWFVVFPWIEPYLPFADGTVEGDGTNQPGDQPGVDNTTGTEEDSTSTPDEPPSGDDPALGNN